MTGSGSGSSRYSGSRRNGRLGYFWRASLNAHVSIGFVLCGNVVVPHRPTSRPCFIGLCWPMHAIPLSPAPRLSAWGTLFGYTPVFKLRSENDFGQRCETQLLFYTLFQDLHSRLR